MPQSIAREPAMMSRDEHVQKLKTQIDAWNKR
jgi:hypothetical protein